MTRTVKGNENQLELAGLEFQLTFVNVLAFANYSVMRAKRSERGQLPYSKTGPYSLKARITPLDTFLTLCRLFLCFHHFVFALNESKKKPYDDKSRHHNCKFE